jgi:hypothetical protein
MSAPDSPVLTLAGKTFRCVPFVPQWHLMKLAASMTKDDMTALAGMYEFLRSLILPEDWSAFDAHMGTLDIEKDQLDNAIGDTLVQMAGRGKDSDGSSTPSSDGLPNPATPPMSRVVSLSKGTVDEVPVHPSWGGPESSTA